jgi:hydrogenase expression/formation protein HypC
MCLGVPGKIVSIDAPLVTGRGMEPSTPGLVMGRVNFSGIVKEVCLAYVPEAQLGDYVIVHAGFAISRIDEEEAQAIFALLGEMAELAESGSEPA